MNKDGDFNLKYWYITPAVYENSEWKLYSNKNIRMTTTLRVNHRNESSMFLIYIDVTSELNLESKTNQKKELLQFFGDNRTDSRLYIPKTPL